MEEDINDTSEVLQVMGHIAPLPAPFQQRIASELHTEVFPARHLLLCPGETARRVYYIKKGFLRAYFIDQHGKKHTSWFMARGDVMISVHSFFTQKPAQEYIEVLQEAILQSLTWGQLQAYYADFREGNLIGRILTEKYYILSEERSISLRTQTLEERYDYLLQQHPNIHQFTTTDNIASYLGTSRETISRIRSKLLSSAKSEASAQKNHDPSIHQK